MVSSPAVPPTSYVTRDPKRHGGAGLRADDDRRPEPTLQLLDASLQERLFVARRFVVGVLPQVAQLSRMLDALDDLGPFHLAKPVELDLQ